MKNLRKRTWWNVDLPRFGYSFVWELYEYSTRVEKIGLRGKVLAFPGCLIIWNGLYWVSMVNWFHIFNTEIICHHKKSLFNTFMCRTAWVIEGVQRERERLWNCKTFWKNSVIMWLQCKMCKNHPKYVRVVRSENEVSQRKLLASKSSFENFQKELCFKETYLIYLGKNSNVFS